MNSVNTSLNSLFHSILLGTVDQAAAKTEAILFPDNITQDILSLQNIQLFWMAKEKLKDKTLTLKLAQLMEKIEKAASVLHVPDPLKHYWKRLLGPRGLADSQVNAIIENTNQGKLFPNLLLAANFLATDWIGNRKTIQEMPLDYSAYDEQLIYFKQICQYLLTETPVYQRIAEFVDVYSLIAQVKEIENLEEGIKVLSERIINLSSGDCIFIPVGWNVLSGDVGQSELLALQFIKKDYDCFEIRFLNHSHEFVETEINESNYPCLTWSNVHKNNLSLNTLLKALFEPFASMRCTSQNHYIYDARWIACVINRVLKQSYDSVSSHMSEKARELDPMEIGRGIRNLTTFLSSPQTGKSHPLGKPALLGASNNLRRVKGKRSGNGLDTILHQIVMILLNDTNSYKSWKISQRLYVLVHLFHSLKEQKYPLSSHRDVMEIFSKAETNLWTSLHKLAKQLPDQDPLVNLVRQQSATLLDLKIRYEKLTQVTPIGSLPVVKSPFRILPLFFSAASISNSPHQEEQPTFSVQFMGWEKPPIGSSITNLNQWLERAIFHITAIHKTHRFSEWLAVVNRHVLQHLRIPDSNTNEWKLPPHYEIREVVRLMKNLYNLTNHLLYHASEKGQILPWHVLNINKVLRIQFELFNQLVPPEKDRPICWAHLHAVMNSRGHDLFPQALAEEYHALCASFKAISPHGHKKGPVVIEGKQTVALFDTSYDGSKFSKEDRQNFRFVDLEVQDQVQISDKIGVTTAGFLEAYRQVYDEFNLDPTISYAGVEISYSNHLPLMAWLYLSQTAVMSQLANCELPELPKDSRTQRSDSGPNELYKYHRFRMSIYWGGDVYWFPATLFYSKEEYHYHRATKIKAAPQHKLKSLVPAGQFQRYCNSLSELTNQQFLAQAEILRTDRNLLQTHYECTMIAEGPANLTIDHLISFFEIRQDQLFKPEERQFFLSVFYTSDFLNNYLKVEPAALQRLIRLMEELETIDSENLLESLHKERFFFNCEIFHHIWACTHNRAFLQGIRQKLCSNLLKMVLHESKEHKAETALYALVLLEDDLLMQLPLNIQFNLILWHGSCQTNDPSTSHLRVIATERTHEIGARLIKDPSVFTLFGIPDTIQPEPLPEKFSFISRLKIQFTEKLAFFNWINDLHKKWDLSYPCPEFNAVKQFKLNLSEQVNELAKEIKCLEASFYNQKNKLYVSETSLYYIGFGEVIEVDFTRGLVFRNGVLLIESTLPPEVQQLAEFAVFKKIPLQSMNLQGDHLSDRKGPKYRPRDCERKHLQFGLYPHRAYYDDYEFIHNHESKGWVLPLALKTGFTVWVNQTALICYHDTEGYPIPVYSIDLDRRIHPINQPELFLAEDSNIPEALFLSRLGYERSQLLVWLDKDHNVARIDVPANYRNETLSFNRRNGLWVLKDLTVVDTFSAPKGFLGDHFYLIVKNEQGTFQALLEKASVEKQRKQHYIGNAQDLWQKHLQNPHEKQLSLFSIDQEGWLTAHSTADHLYLAYLFLMNGFYDKAAGLIENHSEPLGRCYSVEEIQIILEVICSDKEDNHPNACSIKLLALYRFLRHNREYPVNLSEVPEELRVFCFESNAIKLTEQDKILFTTTVSNKAKTLLYLYDKGSAPLERCRFERLMTQSEREDFALLLLLTEDSEDYLSDEFLSRLQSQSPIKMITYEMVNDRSYNFPNVSSHLKGFYQIFFAMLSLAEQQSVPIDSLKWMTVPHLPMLYFRRAYQLITDRQPNEPADQKEYEALVSYLTSFYELSRLTISHHSPPLFVIPTSQSSKRYNDDCKLSMCVPWLLLRAIKEFKEKNPLLKWPSLPQEKNAYQLKIVTDQDTQRAESFIQQLCTIIGTPLDALIDQYRINVVPERTQLLLIQDKKYPDQEPFRKSFTHLATPSLLRWLSERHVPNIPKGHALNRVRLKELTLLSQEELKDRILETENAAPNFSDVLHFMSVRPPLSLDACISLALSGKCSAEGFHLIFAYLIKATERAYEYPRAYVVCEDNLPLLCHEYYAKQRLRQDQVDLIQLMRQDPSNPKIKGKAAQLIMGAGKTKVLAPILALLASANGHVSIFCVPAALYGTVKEDFVEMMRSRFNRRVDVFTFRRDECTLEKLYVIADKFMRAEQDGAILITRPKDLHAFKLMLKERFEIERLSKNQLLKQIEKWAKTVMTIEMRQELKRLSYETTPKGLAEAILNDEPLPLDTSLWKQSVDKLHSQINPEEIELLESLHEFLKTRCKILFDEFSFTFDPRNQISFPTGYHNQANPESFEIAVKIYFEWLPEIEDIIGLEKNEQSYHAKNESLFTQFLLDQGWTYFRPEIGDSVTKEGFYDYVQHRHTPSAQRFYSQLKLWNQKTTKRTIVQQLSFYRYAVSQGLKGCFQAVAHENYGRSKELTQFKLVIPFECMDVPKEGTQFKKCHETLLKTCQYYRFVWNDPEMTKDLIHFVYYEKKRTESAFLSEYYVLLFGEVFNLKRLEDVNFLKEKTNFIQQSLKSVDPKTRRAALRLVGHYLRHRIFPEQLKLDVSQLSSNPQDLIAIGKTTNGFGGTVTFSDTWPLSVERHHNRDVDQLILSVLKDPRNGKTTIVNTSHADTLFTQIGSMITDSTCAIINAGGFFKGMDNETVARRVLSLQPHRKGILFYQQKHDGLSALALLTAAKVIPISGSDHEHIRRVLNENAIDHPLTIYDQAHVVGADIPQKENTTGIILLSNHVTTDSLAQAAARLRMLVKGKQFVEYAVPSILCDNKQWTIDDILRKTDSYQKEKEKQVNLPSIFEQIRGVIRSRLNPKLDKSLEYCSEQQSEDLFEEFGHLSQTLPTYIALEQFIQAQPLKELFPEVSEREAIYSELCEIIRFHKANQTPLPDEINLADHIMDLTQEMDIDRNRQMMQEEENERMDASKIPEKEIPWEEFNAIGPNPLGSYAPVKHPPLYTINDVLKDRGFENLFDDGLLISRNAIVTFKGQANAMLTKEQKPLHYVLVTPQYVVLLSIEEASQIKTLLWNNKVASTWLMEPNGAMIKSGSTPWAPSERINSLLLQAMIVQGDAQHLTRKGLDDLKKWVATRPKEVRDYFEKALSFRDEDLTHYQKNYLLKEAFRSGN